MVTVCLVDSDDDLARRLEDALALHSPENGPDFRWDTWLIDMREGTQALRARPEFAHDRKIVRHRMHKPRPRDPRRCAGGPKRMLDLETDRAAVRDAALLHWDTMQEWLTSRPENRKAWNEQDSWPVYDWQMPPDAPTWVGVTIPRFGGYVGVFSHDRHEYARLLSHRTNATENLLQLDGRWVNDELFTNRGTHTYWDRYYAHADAYLDALDDACWIVRLSVHY